MTCIIAHRAGWMVADRRVTFGDTLIGPFRRDKIRRGAGILVGVSGAAAVGDSIGTRIAMFGSAGLPVDPELALHLVGETMREGGKGSHALVVCGGSLTLFDQDGAQNAIDADFWAIGSGYQAALGWLHGRFCGGAMNVDPQDAKTAISFAAQLNSDIGDGWQSERLTPQPSEKT